MGNTFARQCWEALEQNPDDTTLQLRCLGASGLNPDKDAHHLDMMMLTARHHLDPQVRSLLRRHRSDLVAEAAWRRGPVCEEDLSYAVASLDNGPRVWLMSRADLPADVYRTLAQGCERGVLEAAVVHPDGVPDDVVAAAVDHRFATEGTLEAALRISRKGHTRVLNCPDVGWAGRLVSADALVARPDLVTSGAGETWIPWAEVGQMLTDFAVADTGTRFTDHATPSRWWTKTPTRTFRQTLIRILASEGATSPGHPFAEVLSTLEEVEEANEPDLVRATLMQLTESVWGRRQIGQLLHAWGQLPLEERDDDLTSRVLAWAASYPDPAHVQRLEEALSVHHGAVAAIAAQSPTSWLPDSRRPVPAWMSAHWPEYGVMLRAATPEQVTLSLRRFREATVSDPDTWDKVVDDVITHRDCWTDEQAAAVLGHLTGSEFMPLAPRLGVKDLLAHRRKHLEHGDHYTETVWAAAADVDDPATFVAAVEALSGSAMTLDLVLEAARAAN